MRLIAAKRLEFLYEQSKGPETLCVFKHALTQEVVYESLLPAERQGLHAAAGRALEALYKGRLDDAYDRLAYHYSKTDNAPRAVEYLTRFARAAARRFAHSEAVAALREALVHAERLPVEEREPRLVDLTFRQAHSLFSLGRFRESLDLLLKQQDRVEQVADPRLVNAYYFWLSDRYSHLGDHERAAQSSQRALEEAERSGDEASLGKAYYGLARDGFWIGRYPEAVEHAHRAISLLEATKELAWLGMSLNYLAQTYFHMGEFGPALEACARAAAIAEALGDRRLQCYATWGAGIVHTASGELAEGLEACQRAMELAPDPVYRALALGFLGYAYLEQGDLARATAASEQAVRELGQFRYRALEALFLTHLAEGYLLSGDSGKARIVAEQGLNAATDAKYWFTVALAHRVLGMSALSRGVLSEAETHLNRALEIDTSIQARCQVGYTQLQLARLAHAQGNLDAVATHLKEARSLFTALRIPKYAERTIRLAADLGVSLA